MSGPAGTGSFQAGRCATAGRGCTAIRFCFLAGFSCGLQSVKRVLFGVARMPHPS